MKQIQLKDNSNNVIGCSTSLGCRFEGTESYLNAPSGVFNLI